jgi:hypothetical protein
MTWVLDWMIGFINTLYIHTTWDYMHYSAIAILHTLQFTVPHAVGFSAFTSHILATGLSQSHCNFKSHVKSPSHSQFLSCYYSAAENFKDLTQFNSSAPKLMSWQVGAPKLDSPSCATLLYFPCLLTCPFITPWHRPHGKHHLLLLRRHSYWSVT